MPKVVSLQAVKKVIIFTIGIHEILKDPLGPALVAAKPMRPPWRDASMMSSATSDQNGAAVSGMALSSNNHIPGATVVGTTLGTVIRPVVSVSWLVEPNVPIYWVASRDGEAAHQIPTSTTAAADHPRLHSELSTLAPPFIPEGMPSGKPSSRQLHHGSSLGSPASQRPHRPTRSHSHAESFQSLVSQKEGGAVGVSAAPVEKPIRPSSPVRIWSRKLGKEGASTRESRDSYRTARGTGGGRDLQVAASESALGQYIPALESIAEGMGPNDKHELRSSACESPGYVKTGDIKGSSKVMDPPRNDALPDREAADASVSPVELSSLSSSVSFPQTSVKSIKNPSKQTRSPVASPSGKTADIPKLAESKQESTHLLAPPRIAKPVAQPQTTTSSAHSWASLSHHPAQEWKVVSHYKKGAARRIPIRPSHSNIEGPEKINLLSSPRSPDIQQKSAQTSREKLLESSQSQDPQDSGTESGWISGNMKDDFGPNDRNSDQDVNHQCLVSKGIHLE
ncbi:hypothetical protein PGTUg99_007832 [Puccinia graminis f. sp. tritici]|uniref:Uncharacterized protein n=1 Tax=Puccinia graminis f. sp. tritici TaxID=56615 RepID=A0A5B0NDN7_PUCGR|nr:hypothetical protein PGTUg99_007832 [Puccinia graminis f. sp. tritici]